ncbi:MAG: TetR/AcrR family transcriptional regulator [Bradymonadaceae bacterium]
MENHPTNQERRRARRLQTIKDTALELIAEDGLDGFSVHRLADRLDLTVGALYRYFDSVDHLLSAIQVDILESFDQYLGDVAHRLQEQTPLRQFVAICQAYVALDALQPERFRLIARFVSGPDPRLDTEAAKSAMEPTSRLLGHLARVIEEGQRLEQLSPGSPLDRAIIAWSSLQGMADRRKLTRLQPEVFDTKRLTRELLRSFLLGWGAQAEDIDAALDDMPDRAFFETSLPSS